MSDDVTAGEERFGERYRPSAPDTQASGNSASLEVSRLSAGYGDLRALWDVSFRVDQGRIVALLGPNGAGKSTTVHAIGGIVRVFGGTLTCDGIDLRPLSAAQRVSRAQIGIVREGKRIFRRRTVEQNLRVGLWPIRHQGRAALHEALDGMYEQFPILDERRKTRAGLLSGGQQQMLAIAQVLISRPKFIVLDEPSAGLAPVIVGEVWDILRGLRRQGLGILLVEQLVDVTLAIADSVVVLSGGRVAASGTIDEVGGSEGMRHAYLRGETEDPDRATSASQN